MIVTKFYEEHEKIIYIISINRKTNKVIYVWDSNSNRQYNINIKYTPTKRGYFKTMYGRVYINEDIRKNELIICKQM